MSSEIEVPLFRLRGWHALVALALLAALFFLLARKRFGEESIAAAQALIVERIPLELAREQLPALKRAASADGAGFDAAARTLLETCEVAPEDITVDAFTARGAVSDEVTVFKTVFRVHEGPPRTMYFQMDYRAKRGWLASSLQQTTRLHYWLNLW